MKIFKTCLCVLLACISAMSMPMGGSTRTVIPADVQQIISVDYRALKNSDTAMQLKQQVLPPAMKAFEDALKGVGIIADRDVDQLTFASYRTKTSLRVVGIATGEFQQATVLKKIRINRIRPVKYRKADLYSMGSGMQMTFLDDGSLLFGDASAVKGALDARDGYTSTLDANNQF